ncbi:MAG: ABC transporter ATP-binding protein [Oscillospiraceae bacterium]|nr:ABC transporter ATP-binding protein [Oscillospiraceae bacterium]
MKEVLKIEHLSKAYLTQGNRMRILEDLNLTVVEREFLCILGPSGCGKSTLLRCIAGFEDFEGTMICNGKTVKGPSTERIMVFQDYNQLFPWKSVAENLEYPLKIKGMRDKHERRAVTEEYLSKVGLAEYRDFYPHELSGGMKQRVAIAKALALKPEIILMDEPFAALDAITRNRLQAELQRIFTEEKITVIFVTHNIQEALTLGTRVILMDSDGAVRIDKINPLEKPVKPSSPGYGELWDLYSQGLEGRFPAD